MSRFDLIAFDADDTLWHSEIYYARAQAKLRQILAAYNPEADLVKALLETETANLKYYGYGAKGFTLSAIETLIRLSSGRVTAADIQAVIEQGKEMLSPDVELLEHVALTLAELSKHYELMVITKGDLIHQENKLTQSGLQGYFKYVEIVSDKTGQTYASLLARVQVKPERFLMVGNSLRSDVLPVVALGGQAVFIPYQITWEHEHVESEPGTAGYHQLEHIGELPGLLQKLEGVSAI
jgi:putative hydrolase of the HAD superfamily